MEDVRPIREIDTGGEVRVCPDCGYGRGFHVTLPAGEGDRQVVLCCPECGARFTTGWRLRL